MLGIVVTWKFPCRLPHCAQYTVAEAILRSRSGSCCHENEIYKQA